MIRLLIAFFALSTSALAAPSPPTFAKFVESFCASNLANCISISDTEVRYKLRDFYTAATIPVGGTPDGVGTYRAEDYNIFVKSSVAATLPFQVEQDREGRRNDYGEQKRKLLIIKDVCEAGAALCISAGPYGVAFWPTLLVAAGCAATAWKCGEMVDREMFKVDQFLAHIAWKEKKEAEDRAAGRPVTPSVGTEGSPSSNPGRGSAASGTPVVRPERAPRGTVTTIDVPSGGGGGKKKSGPKKDTF